MIKDSTRELVLNRGRYYVIGDELAYSNNSSVLRNAKSWHQKLGYLNFGSLRILSEKMIVNIFIMIERNYVGLCMRCYLGKNSRNKHLKVKDSHSKRILKLLHMDIVGPINPRSLNDKKYFLTAVYIMIGFEKKIHHC